MQTRRDRLCKSPRPHREGRGSSPSLHKRRLPSNHPGSRWLPQRPSPPPPVSYPRSPAHPFSGPFESAGPAAPTLPRQRPGCPHAPQPAASPCRPPSPRPATPRPHAPAGGTFSRGGRALRVPAPQLREQRQLRPERGPAPPATASHLSEGAAAAGRGRAAPLTPEAEGGGNARFIIGGGGGGHL